MYGYMNGQDFSLPSIPPISIKFSRVVIFICDLEWESEVNDFTMKQTRNYLFTKPLLSSVFMSFTIQFLLSANVFCSFCLPLSQLSLLHARKMHTVEVINYQLRLFQVLGRKTKQSSQQARLILITGKHQIKTNSQNFSAWLRAPDHESWTFIEVGLAIHGGAQCRQTQAEKCTSPSWIDRCVAKMCIITRTFIAIKVNSTYKEMSVSSDTEQSALWK